MAIRKTLKKHSKSKRSHHHYSKKTRKTQRKSHKSHKSHRHYKKNSKKSKHSKNQRGGFGCGPIASVKEPGFELPALGSAPGLSIPDMRGIIYRPDCKPDTYQAMVPK